MWQDASFYSSNAVLSVHRMTGRIGSDMPSVLSYVRNGLLEELHFRTGEFFSVCLFVNAFLPIETPDFDILCEHRSSQHIELSVITCAVHTEC